jgi:phosphoribosylanthranilate isomerase
MYRIKICGITSVDDALMAAEAGADAIGINCYAQSPRYVDAERAGLIVQAVCERFGPETLEIYAVFVNATADDILWTFRDADLYGSEQSVGIQLHGDEPPELMAELKQHGLGRSNDLLIATGHAPLVPIVRAFRCRGGELTSAAAHLAACQQLGVLPQAVLIDAYQPGAYGGTGQTADWNAIGARRETLLNLPVVLAGGLTSANVAAAIRAAHSDAVDVASGVESAPGRKDFRKVHEFVAAAKNVLGGP